MTYTPHPNSEVARSLAGDLAEDAMASNIAEMMIPGSREVAKAIRERSDENIDQLDHMVHEYRATYRAIYSALWTLLDGHKGYKLAKQADAKDAEIERLRADARNAGFVEASRIHGAEIERLRAAIAAERARIISLLHGIDRIEADDDGGWWETSAGALFGASVLAEIQSGEAK